jgi:hypothetical protein
MYIIYYYIVFIYNILYKSILRILYTLYQNANAAAASTDCTYYIYIYTHRNNIHIVIYGVNRFPFQPLNYFFFSRYIDLSTSKALGEFVENRVRRPGPIRMTWSIRI